MHNSIKIEVNRLVVRFPKGNREIRFDDMVFHEGDFVMITGKNGAGKSTFIKLFIRSRNKDENYEAIQGTIDLFDIDHNQNYRDIFHYEDSKPYLNQLIFIDQEDKFPSHLRTIHQCLVNDVQLAWLNNRFLRKERKLKSLELERLAEYYIDYFLTPSINAKAKVNVNAKEIKRMRYNELSGGQKKLVSIIISLLKFEMLEGAGNILFMDEPLNNLDSLNKMLLNNLIVDLRERYPKLIIFVVTHCRAFHGINKELHIGDSNAELFTKDRNFAPCDSFENDVINQRYVIDL